MPAVLRVCLALGATAAAACGGGAHPETGAVPAAVSYHAADAAFMRHMLVHHAQALEMTALVDGRSENPTIARLAERIRASQVSEIARMRGWLDERGLPAEPPGQHDPAQHAGMPGMLSAAELGRLAAARGDQFDRLFLEYMIRHHQGALTMVAELFAAEGGGQEPELFRLASDVDADQRAEIARMQRLLTTLDPGSP
jgi:uncharacterized protein (DUF305 family)